VTVMINASGQLRLLDVAAPASPTVDSVQLWSQSMGGSSELRAMDEAGNTLTLTPHRFNLFTPDESYEMPFSYSCQNPYIGKEVNVDIYGAMKAIEELTGKKFIHLRDLPDGEVLDWDAEQNKLFRQREKERRQWAKGKVAFEKTKTDDSPPYPSEPEKYVRKEPPAWLKPLLKKKRRQRKK
jgi:hypothetical protein